MGGEAGAQTCISRATAGHRRRQRGVENRRRRKRISAPRVEAPLRRHYRIGWRGAGIHRRTIPLVFSAKAQANEFVLHTHRRYGYVFERAEHTLRSAWSKPRDHDWLHILDRCDCVFYAADPVRTAGYGFDRWSGRADRTGHRQGIRAHEDSYGFLESRPYPWIAAVFSESRWLRAGRRRLDVCTRGI